MNIHICIRMVFVLVVMVLTSCTRETFTSNSSQRLFAGEAIVFGASEIPVPTAVHFVIDASPSMISKQVSVGNALRDFMDDLYESSRSLGYKSDIQISVSTSTMFPGHHLLTQNKWPFYTRFENDLPIIYDPLHVPMPNGIEAYENPFAKVVVTKMIDHEGKEVQSLGSSSRFSQYEIDYKVVTEPLVASFRIGSGDGKAKFDQIGDSLFEAMQVGGRGSSLEHSLFSAYRNVFDNILPNLSTGGQNTGNVVVMLVTDEDSSENLYRGSTAIPVSSAISSGKLTAERVPNFSWQSKDICDADPTGCRDYPNPAADQIAERINFKYRWVNVTAKCNKILDGVDFYGDHTVRLFRSCTLHGADFCQQPVGVPMEGVFKAAASIAVGCSSVADSVQIDSITNASSASVFIGYDPNLNRLTDPFTHGGVEYANMTDYYYKIGFSATDLTRVAPAVFRESSGGLRRGHELTYINDEIKELSSSTSATTRQGVPAALGKELINRLNSDDRVASFYLGAIVNTNEPTGSDPGARATSILSTVDYANQVGGLIGGAAAFPITQRDFGFIGDVLKDFVQKSAIGSYVLPERPGFRVHSLSVEGADGQLTPVDFTNTRSNFENATALLEGRRLTFNIEKLTEVLGLDAAAEGSIAKKLESYKLIPYYVKQ